MNSPKFKNQRNGLNANLPSLAEGSDDREDGLIKKQKPNMRSLCSTDARKVMAILPWLRKRW